MSTLYMFTQHGDPQVRRLVKQLLNQAYQPLNAMLNSWIFDGELHDHYHEVLCVCMRACVCVCARIHAYMHALTHACMKLQSNMPHSLC